MENKITHSEEIESKLKFGKKNLPTDLRDLEIVENIIVEVYNSWPGYTGLERVSDCLNFINNKMPQYSAAIGESSANILNMFAAARSCNYTNWFQEAYLPDLSGVLVFDTVEDFKKKFPSGKYLCPHCEGITTDYQTCNSGKKLQLIGKKKGEYVCDWKVYGLLGDLGKGIRVLIKDKYKEFPKPIHMFKPIELTEKETA